MPETSISLLAIGQMSKANLARQADRAAARPIGERAIGLNVHPNYSSKPFHERRYSACIFRWQGERWAKQRKISGPRLLEDARDECDFQSRRFRLPILTET